MKETKSNERSTGAKNWTVEVEKLQDAHNAGTKSEGCTLILAEGDSATNLADHDGCHIKGLIINLFHSLWPFVKATHKTIGLKTTFHSNSVYEDWKKCLGNEAIQWSINNYKGLGRISSKEGKELFSDVDAHTKALYWSSDEDGLALERAFGKENAEDRKLWLQNLPTTHLERTGPQISIRDFINLEVVFFFRAKIKRSIPLMLDGLKPSNRKVLCTLFKNNQKVTVEQLSFDVSKSCGYHHSQEKTIIGMAQDFVGSPNNINLLEPDGQFGSRFSGGTDASNPKYISTNLSAMARVLFPKDDDFHLQCLIEDGKYIEPSNYLPVIPTILVNGAKGIGSAWSTFVPKYNPREIVENIRRFLNGEGMRTMDPWYRNFKGTIQKVKPKEGASEEGPCTYKLSGIFKKINETTIVITELPIGKWTRKYLRFLQDLKKKDLIQGFKNDSDDKSINITITLTKEKMKEVSHKGIQKNFKLSTAISTWNMNLLQIVGSLSLIKRYNTPKEILEDFTVIRLQAYEERRKEMLKKLKPEVCKIEDKLAFIRGLLSGEIQKNANIIRTLEEKEFVPFPHNAPGSYEYLFEGLMAMMTNPAN